MSFNAVFAAMFAAFAIILVYGGWVTRKWINDSTDYLLAGRQVSLLINTFGVAAIGFAGTSITVVPGLVVSGGFWSSFSFSVAYLIAGLMLYGVIFARFIRRCGAQTLPEWLEMRFDSRTRTVITVTTILGLLGILANNIVSMALVVSGFTGWNYLITSSIVFAVFLFFTYVGGFWAVTLTDFVQMVIGLIALPVLLIALMAEFGGLGWAAENWPGPAGIMAGGLTGTHLPILTLKYPSVLMFFVLFGAFLVWGNNYYWLRVATSRSERVARLSYVYAGLLLLVFNYLILQFIGMYAGAALPEQFAMSGGEGTASPFAAFGVVLRVAPMVVASFALIAALASSVSTATTAHMGATTTAVRDLYPRLFKPTATAKQLVKPSRVIMLILGLLVWGLTFYPGGPLYLFAFANAWLGPPAVLVVLGVFWPRMTKEGAFWGAIVSISAMMIVAILSLAKVFAIENYMHQGAFGLIITLVLVLVISMVTKPKYYGAANWDLNGAGSQVEFDQLNETEQRVLTLIGEGYRTMGEITDFIGIDSHETNDATESLDKKRLIRRRGLRGSAFYEFELNTTGRQCLPVASDLKKRLVEDDVTERDIQLLRIVNTDQSRVINFSEQSGLSSLQVSVVIAKLVRQGYLKEGGVMRRRVKTTTSGQSLLKKYPEVQSS